jgi:anti-anti-sigma factor
MLQKEIENLDNATVISIFGRVHTVIDTEFEKDVLDTIRSSPGDTVVIDLSGLPSINSSFLRLLFEMKKVAEKRGCVLKLCGLSQNSIKVLEVTDTKGEFLIYDTKEEALSS